MNFDPFHGQKDTAKKSEVEHVEQEKQEYRLIAKMLRRKGMSLYEFDPRTGNLQKVEILPKKMIAVNFKSRQQKQPNKTKYQSYVDPNCIYFEALNYKTAQKRLRKYKEGKIKKLTNIKVAKAK